MPEQRNTPRPSGYLPPTPNQFRQATVDDCTWYASSWSWAKASDGKLLSKPIDVRRTVDPDLKGPTRLSVATAAYEDYFGVRSVLVDHYQSPYYRVPFSDAIDLLDFGATFVVAGDYEDLPYHYRRWTNNDVFDHAISCTGLRRDIKFGRDTIGSTWVYDPLGGGSSFQPYDGEWMPVEALLQDFAWVTNGAISLLALGPNQGDTMLNVALPDSLPREAVIRAGGKLHKSPKPTATILRTLTNERTLPFIGRVSGDFPWVVVKWDDNAVYVNAKDVKEVKDAPVIAGPDPIVIDPNPELVARITALEGDLSVAAGVNQKLADRIFAAKTALDGV